MPFLTEELWQRLPKRPGDNTQSICIAEYPHSVSEIVVPIRSHEGTSKNVLTNLT